MSKTCLMMVAGERSGEVYGGELARGRHAQMDPEIFGGGGEGRRQGGAQAPGGGGGLGVPPRHEARGNLAVLVHDDLAQPRMPPHVAAGQHHAVLDLAERVQHGVGPVCQGSRPRGRRMLPGAPASARPAPAGRCWQTRDIPRDGRPQVSRKQSTDPKTRSSAVRGGRNGRVPVRDSERDRERPLQDRHGWERLVLSANGQGTRAVVEAITNALLRYQTYGR